MPDDTNEAGLPDDNQDNQDKHVDPLDFDDSPTPVLNDDAEDAKSVKTDGADDDSGAEDTDAGAAEDDGAETSAPEKAEPQKEVISAEMLDLAQSQGISIEEASGFADNASLQRALKMVMTQRVAQQQQTQTQEDKAATESAPEPFKLDLPDLDPDIASEAEIAMQGRVKAMHEHYEAQMSQMQGSLQQIAQAVTQQHQTLQNEQQHAMVKRFDNWVTKLEDAEELFGKGSTQELDPNSAQYKNRVRLDESAKTLAAGYAYTNKTMPSEAVLWEKARLLEFSTETAASVRNQAFNESQKRNGRGQFTARASHRREAPKGNSNEDIRQRAVAKIREAQELAQNG